MDPNVKLNTPIKDDGSEPQGENDPKITHGYIQLIGLLMYLAIATRSNITFAVNRLAQYMSNLKPLHWAAVISLLRK